MIQNDEPIQEASEDSLGRAGLAQVIAGEIRLIDAASGSVVGILGAWGSGKTSLINLIRKELSGPPWIRSISFNPWMFSGSAQLVDRFFSELAAQLRSGPERLPQLADAIEDYGEIISPLQIVPLVGTWIGWISGASKGLKELRAKRRGGIEQQRDQVASRLQSLDAPIVVVIDDIDRLRHDEIRDIFKLVRLTGSFPNIIYLVAFDRLRVEQALAEEGLSGRDYLEKIVQVVYDIPLIPEGVLTDQITSSLNQVLGSIENAGHFESSRWADAFFEVIRPLFKNMRDVRRYSGSISGTIRSLEGRVELVDVLTLEAIRVFLPDAFALIGEMRRTLTIQPDALDTPEKAAIRQAAVDAFVMSAKQHDECVRGLIRRLFPVAGAYIGEIPYGSEWTNRWRRERRVAHPDLLALYLERTASASLDASIVSELAFDLLTNREALDSYLRSIDPHMLENAISGLEAFEEDFPVEAAGPATTVLINLLPEIPDRPQGFFDFDARIKVTRVVLRLLRRLPSSADIETVIRDSLQHISSLTGKLLLLNLVGHEENQGHSLISVDASGELEAALREEIRSATPDRFSAESDLCRLLGWLKRTSSDEEPVFTFPQDPTVGCALLRCAVGEVRRQPLGTRTISVEKRLYWDSLIELLGSEAGVRELVDRCRNECDDAESLQAIELADKYLSGWRPERD